MSRIGDRHLRLAAEAARVGLWLLDPDDGVFWMNDVARDLFGFAPDNRVTLPEFLASIYPDDRARAAEVVRRALEHGEEGDVEYRFVRPDGEIRWVRSRGRIGGGSDAEAPSLMGTSIDVTERRRSADEQAERLRFETVLADLSARFIGLPGDAVDDAILDAQRRMCEGLGFELSSVWQFEPGSADRLLLTHLHRLHEGPTPPQEMDGREHFPWARGELVAGRVVNVPSIERTPPDAARDRETWRHFGIKSTLAFPLSIGGRPPFGVLSFEMTTSERSHPEELVSRLQLVAEVFANALERKRSDEALRSSLAEVERLRDQLERENLYLKSEFRLREGRGRVVGESPAILGVLKLVEQVAPNRTAVLVEGETGVGKELIARRIHELSPRRERPMVKVNCAALPSTLVESELFGHEQGAYTGAVSREPGRFELADGSTIFLDEISELPLELQSKLLRVLEEGEFERVGSARTLTTDVRVVAATNRDLRAEVEAGRFRRDLFFRIAVFPVAIPPLRERREDIPLLVWSAVEEFSSAMNKAVEGIPRTDMERLQAYDWPGNVRELRNAVERAMILCSGPTLRFEALGGATAADPAVRGDDPVVSLEDAQRRHIEKALEAAGGRIGGPGGAAELLGVKPTTLRSKIQRLGLGRSTGSS